MRDALLTRLATATDLVDVTMWGIAFLSTIPERLLIFVVCAILMALLLAATVRLRSRPLQGFALLAGIFCSVRMLYLVFPREHASVLALVLALPVPLTLWIRRQRSIQPGLGLWRGISVIVLVPAFAVLLLDGWVLQSLATRLHHDASVRKFGGDLEDVNGIEFDARDGLVYVTGQGLEDMLAFDASDLDRPPRKSPVAVHEAESFHFNATDRELYVYNGKTHTVLTLEAGTLARKSGVSDLHLFSGDVVIEHDRSNDWVIVASEGRYFNPTGKPYPTDRYPIAVIDRKTGGILFTVRDCDGVCAPGLIVSHAHRPLLYVMFPQSLVAFDLVTRQVVATRPINQWIDGMVVTPDGKELLVGAPLHAAVLRFDAETLAPLGSIPTVLGVRALAIDSKRNLLLTGSLATNMVDVIDLASSRRLSRHRVAPWLRRIALDSDNAVAYVSSITGLYRVDYSAGLTGSIRRTDQAAQ